MNKRKGFTLLEIMIVVVILSLIATMVLPKIMGRPEQVRRTRAVVEIKNLEAALKFFKVDTGRYPTTAEGLRLLIGNSGIKDADPKGYIDAVPLDPWGNFYKYIYPSRNGKDFDLESYGADGENGGVDENADIESWNLVETES